MTPPRFYRYSNAGPTLGLAIVLSSFLAGRVGAQPLSTGSGSGTGTGMSGGAARNSTGTGQESGGRNASGTGTESGRTTPLPGANTYINPSRGRNLIGPDNKRLLEIWNSLPGVKPVTKFTSRKTGTERIWKALQSLGEAAPAVTPEHVAPQTPEVAPEEAPAKTKATRAKKAPVAATGASGPREGSKTSRVIEMLKREGGVTLQELMTEMGWQQHTTRALMSAGGSLAKKHGLTVVSTKGENGSRVYSLKG